MFIENMPDEIELLAFFESVPVSFERDNISFLYHAKDDNGISIDFSLSVIEGWIQYVIKHGENNIVHNSIDGISSFSVKKDQLGEYLYFELITNGTVNKNIIRLKPYISVSNSILTK